MAEFFIFFIFNCSKYFYSAEELKLELDYDHVALGEIQLALYTFLDTVSLF